MSSWPCKFYNGNGCKNSPEECTHAHVKFCTNELCVANKHTHTIENCGRKGGGGHTQYIAKKKAQAIEKKLPAFNIEEATVAVCEQLYVKVNTVLQTSDGAAEKAFGIKLTAGKLVGMFKAGLKLNELTEMLNKPDVLTERMAEATEILAAYDAAEKAKKTSA